MDTHFLKKKRQIRILKVRNVVIGSNGNTNDHQ